MSPSRTRSRGSRTATSSSRRRTPQKLRKYERADIVKAVLVSAAIVVVTAVIVWLLRPGPPGIPATGGIMNRQPRASWLIVGAIAAGTIACWVIMRGHGRARKRAKVVLPIALVVVLLGAIGLAIAWPGGILRHDVAPVSETPETLPTTPATTPTPSTPEASPSGGTGATGTTGSTGATVSTATTGPPTTPAR
jgi:hypothetical protein